MWHNHSSSCVCIYDVPGTISPFLLCRFQPSECSPIWTSWDGMCARNQNLEGIIIHVSGSRAALLNKKPYFCSNFWAASYSHGHSSCGSLYTAMVMDRSPFSLFSGSNRTENGIRKCRVSGCLHEISKAFSLEYIRPRLMGAKWHSAEVVYITWHRGHGNSVCWASHLQMLLMKKITTFPKEKRENWCSCKQRLMTFEFVTKDPVNKKSLWP